MAILLGPLLALSAFAAAQPVSPATQWLADLLARGRVVLVFWNTWLPEAKAFADLIPEIEATATKQAVAGAIVVFQDDSPEAAVALAAGQGPFRRVSDRRGELLRRFQVTRAPGVLIVEKDGTVRARCGPAPAEVRELLGSLGAT